MAAPADAEHRRNRAGAATGAFVGALAGVAVAGLAIGAGGAVLGALIGASLGAWAGRALVARTVPEDWDLPPRGRRHVGMRAPDDVPP